MVKVSSGGVVEEAVFEDVKATSQALVERLDEAIMIVDFFNKPDDIDHGIYARKGLITWYKRQAEKKIREKVERYAHIVGVETGVIRIKSFKSRWGSCTPYGDLEFNWVIMMAPNRVVDYVVIHELCHLIQMDHSPQFWREVERVMPDYFEHKEWLKDNGHKLVI
ncbi:M48 family metallopeptidase [Photobacterium sp. GB-50]|uniref:M48 family metallopeptidase n=1 Tax=Photobacterium sp. GB-50 TaxID=2022107 RepID=UPI001E329F39|nr:SprT family zinc-dependent metalloprotease [Photobacterium sp. GB-50]